MPGLDMTRKRPSKRDAVVRVGDPVRVLADREYIGCGYDHDIASFTNAAREQHGERINAFLREIAGVPVSRRDFSDVALAVGKVMLRDALRRSCGEERKLRFRGHSGLTGRVGIVKQVFCVRTGVYSPSYGSGEDYEPAYLDDAKVHTVAVVKLAPFQFQWEYETRVLTVDLQKLWPDARWEVCRRCNGRAITEQVRERPELIDAWERCDDSTEPDGENGCPFVLEHVMAGGLTA